MLKILLLGDSAVGKTCLLNQFVNREFSATYQATIGSDFSSKQLEVNGHYVTLQIWDTAGQERFQSLGPTFYRGTDICIFVYDVTKPQSFENIARWKSEFDKQLEITGDKDFPYLLLGNKSDLPDKAVQPSAAREYAQMNGEMIFMEVSAKTSEGVQTAFEKIVTKALEKVPEDPGFILPEIVVNPQQKAEPKKGGCC